VLYSLILSYIKLKCFSSKMSCAYNNMVKSKKFTGRKIPASYVGLYHECVERDVYTANDTPIAPFLNHALHANVQAHIMSFLGDVSIHTAYYEDSMYYDEKRYCERLYTDDFSIDHV